MEELNRVTYVIASPSLACIFLCAHVTPLPRLTPMDRTFADAIILDALSHDPERVKDAVAKVAREFVESAATQPKRSRPPLTSCVTNWRGTFSPATSHPF